MTPPELFTSAKAKAKPCCWILLSQGAKICSVRSVGMVGAGPYCAEHIEKAAKMFGREPKFFAPTI